MARLSGKPLYTHTRQMRHIILMIDSAHHTAGFISEAAGPV
jgi:hypothetical protein